MRNIAVIVHRELKAYYESAIGYMFLVAFLLLGNFLFVRTFFQNPVAEMRDYFVTLPFFLCILVPAFTMRSWAEERKENTLEMLLTFPMKVSQLVLGKYLACMLFFVLALACTGTMPLMLSSLARPDWGPIVCSYVGTALLGSFFISLGLFFSSLSRDQIVAFLVSAIACYFLYLAGLPFVFVYMDGWFPGLGTLISQIIGVADHYESFGRGVLELSDVLFFVGWTAVFLIMNWMYLEGRSRPANRSTFAMAAGLLVGIGFAANWVIAGESLGRFDLTEDRLYTVSDATRRILSQLKVPVQLKIYITPSDKMPTEMKTLEREILDKLDEMRIASGGNLQYAAIHMEAANVLAQEDDPLTAPKKEGDASKEEALEKRLLDKGVRPFPVRALREDQTVTQMVYSSIGIAYKDQREEYIPQVMPQMMDQLEYLLVNTIYKLTKEKRPRIAMVAPTYSIDIPPHMERIYRQLGQPIPRSEDPYEDLMQILRSEKYDVARVALTPQEPMPEEYDTLLIINPKKFNDRQRWELARALRAGKPTILAIQNYVWNYRIVGEGFSATMEEAEPGLDDLLRKYGLDVDPEILMDHNHETLTINDPTNRMARQFGGMPITLPTHVVVMPTSMNPDHPITARVSALFYLWGSAIGVSETDLREKGLKSTILLSSSEKAWLAPKSNRLSEQMIRVPEKRLQSYPLAALVEGTFPDVNAGKERPAWPAPAPPGPGEPMPPPTPSDPPAAELEARPGRLLLIGCAEMFTKNFLGYPGHLDFVLNAIDSMTLGEDIVQVRGKKRVDRSMDKPTSAQSRWWWFVNLGLINMIVAGVGIGGAFMRRRMRESYTMAQGG